MITTAYSKSGTDLLNELLLKIGYGQNEVSNIIATITYPKQHTPLFESQKSLVEIGIEIQGGKINKKSINQKLLKWVDQFGNIPVNYCEEPWGIKDVQNQIDTILKKDCKSELLAIENNHKNKESEARNLIKEINNIDVESLAYGLAEGTYINEYRKNIFSKVSLGYRNVFKKVAQKSGSNNWRDCFFLTSMEMMDIVSGKKLSLRSIKKSRKVAGVTISNTGELEMLEPSVCAGLQSYVEDLHGIRKSEVVDPLSVVNGFSANKGVLQGIVRVVLSSKDFKKVKRGDILVATMTSVDFVPVMEKAGAFVTNEGGVMCHASIVAREMNKPCIIGTKIATKVLKDGDLVEVDAEKGIVTILKKSNEK
jgi:phosphohistidine swiveling domain-containing protein